MEKVIFIRQRIDERKVKEKYLYLFNVDEAVKLEED